MANEFSSDSQECKLVFRPWGSYRSLLQCGNHQIKEIFVKPGQRLSLQSHQHRSEHWVVVKGPVLVTLGNDERLLAEGEHVFIPKKVRHRLANPGREEIKVIEVQIGTYLGEDDIIRYQDDYHR
jgi:mannose-6-phosphate isomerase-like protein (cupin superfamily)